jgi:hypothetical protein
MGKREPLAGDAEVAAMHAKLQNKLKQKVEVMPSEPGVVIPVRASDRVDAGAASAENTLKWEKVNDWLMRTACGRYRCRKYIPGESIDTDSGPPKYQLEMLVQDLWYYRCGPPVDSFKEAKAAAEKHMRVSKP